MMQLALDLAAEAFAAEEVPVGAVIVEIATGLILGTGRNETEENGNPLLHAEMLAIERALKSRQGNAHKLTGCALYVTLEPCPMCAHAISLARCDRLYFGAYDPKGGGIMHGPKVYSHSTCNHIPEVYAGIQEAACADLLKRFFQRHR